MNSVTAIGLFCEDVRQEVGGTITLVGILADNISVPSIDGAIPKLAMYVRANIPVDSPPEQAYLYLCDEKHRNIISDYDRIAIAENQIKASEQGNSYLGLTFTVVASPYPLQKFGRIWLELDYGTQNIYAGSLNIVAETINS